MQELKIIAFTHKSIGLGNIGQFHLDDTEFGALLQAAAKKLGVNEIMFLSTCNRVEIVMRSYPELDKAFASELLQAIYPAWSPRQVEWAVDSALCFEGEEALRHLLYVTASIDSLVVGEREIITQVRTSYERCQQQRLTGDLLRLVVKHCIETAKKVYTDTSIARNPVSVVSLAYHQLRDLNVQPDARILVIGAGQTNRNMTRNLRKRGFTNFTIFNRTLENGHALAADIDGTAYALTDLANYTEGFDVILTCTGSKDTIVDKELYRSLVGTDTDTKAVVDLAIPNDFDRGITEEFPVHHIAIDDLRPIAEANLREREKELEHCEDIVEERVADFHEIYRHRQVELAMKDVPRQVRAIQEKAVTEVFASEVSQLDNESKEVLEKVLAYMEKKYNAVTMKMAKEVMLAADRG